MQDYTIVHDDSDSDDDCSNPIVKSNTSKGKYYVLLCIPHIEFIDDLNHQ